jgi:hypothetical protein
VRIDYLHACADSLRACEKAIAGNLKARETHRLSLVILFTESDLGASVTRPFFWLARFTFRVCASRP